MLGKRARKLSAFKWTAAKDEFLLNLLIDYQLKNGRGQPVRWTELNLTFDVAMKVKCNEDTLKNRYQLLKTRYKDWTDLRHGETGLGWDDSKGTIQADDEWWDKKIKENKNKDYKQFRTRGIPPPMEALMAAVFGGTVATGLGCVAPGWKTPVHSRVVDPEQAPSADSFEGTADLDGDMNEVPGPEDQTPEGHMARYADDPMFADLDPGPFSCPTQIPVSRNRKKKGQAHTDGGVGGKRNIRRSQGSSLYQQHLKCSIECNQAMKSLWDAESTSANQASHQPVERNREAVKIVDEMVAEGLFSEDDPLWAFAVFECQKESFVTTFLNVGGGVRGLRFLRYAYNDKFGFPAV